MTVKRLIIFTTVVAAMVLVVTKFGEKASPAMRERCSEMCDRFLDSMPESFPPNRMMADLESLKERTARILDLLEEPGEGKGMPE